MTENLLFTFQALAVRWGPPKLSCWEPAPGKAEGAAAGIPGLQPGWEHPVHAQRQPGWGSRLQPAFQHADPLPSASVGSPPDASQF